VLWIFDRDTKAGEEAVVAQIVDRRLVGGEIEGCNLCRLGLVAEGSLRPLAYQFARLEVVGGEIGVCGVDGIERRVEGDDEDAGLAGFFDGRDDRGRRRAAAVARGRGMTTIRVAIICGRRGRALASRV